MGLRHPIGHAVEEWSDKKSEDSEVPMKKAIAMWTAAIAVFAWTGPLAAHHSLARFDTTTPVWVKGTVVRLERVNPHSIIVLDQPMEDGQIQRWAVDGPGPTMLARMGVDTDFLKAGDVIEVCGFLTKEGASSQRALPQPANVSLDSPTPNMTGRVMSGHLLVMPDGERRFWSDYGVLGKCLNPGETLAIRPPGPRVIAVP
jgi:hypothetical protein